VAEMEKAAGIGSRPQPRKKERIHRRPERTDAAPGKARVIYFDVDLGFGVAVVEEEFSPAVI
jgi:hypothetical protein